MYTGVTVTLPRLKNVLFATVYTRVYDWLMCLFEILFVAYSRTRLKLKNTFHQTWNVEDSNSISTDHVSKNTKEWVWLDFNLVQWSLKFMHTF